MTAPAPKMTRRVVLLALLAVHAHGQAAAKKGAAMYEADGNLLVETADGRGDLIIDGTRVGGAIRALEAKVDTCCAETAKQASARPDVSPTAHPRPHRFSTCQPPGNIAAWVAGLCKKPAGCVLPPIQ